MKIFELLLFTEAIANMWTRVREGYLGRYVSKSTRAVMFVRYFLLIFWYVNHSDSDLRKNKDSDRVVITSKSKTEILLIEYSLLITENELNARSMFTIEAVIRYIPTEK